MRRDHGTNRTLIGCPVAVASDIAVKVRAAIENAEALIVLCSPHAAQSKWVDLEVSRFKSKPGGRVFAVIIDGVPNSGDPRTECFCPSLKVKIDASGLSSDLHASAAYRANLISVMAQRAVAKALA